MIDGMDFRRRLLETLRVLQPVLDVPGVMVVGSEVPNLLEAGAASTLVVSQDVDIGVPVVCHGDVKLRLSSLVGIEPSPDEPSVWIPSQPDLIEVNFVGVDPSLKDASHAYVLEDSSLPLLVFGSLSFMRARSPIEIDGVRVPLPNAAGLMLEKLVTDRSAEKGERDLLVVLGLMLVATESDLQELEQFFGGLLPDLQHAVRSNLTLLSLMSPHHAMPDPQAHRVLTRTLLHRLERRMEGQT